MNTCIPRILSVFNVFCGRKRIRCVFCVFWCGYVFYAYSTCIQPGQPNTYSDSKYAKNTSPIHITEYRPQYVVNTSYSRIPLEYVYSSRIRQNMNQYDVFDARQHNTLKYASNTSGVVFVVQIRPEYVQIRRGRHIQRPWAPNSRALSASSSLESHRGSPSSCESSV